MPIIDPVTQLFVVGPDDPPGTQVYLPPFYGIESEVPPPDPVDYVILDMQDLKRLRAASVEAAAARAAQQAIVDAEVSKLATLSAAAMNAEAAVNARIAQIVAAVQALG